MRCNMNFLNKMERKIGKYAIPNLMIYLIAAYCIGFVIYTVNPNFMLMLTLSPYHILHGQVWRLITWILMPTDTRVFSLLIMALFIISLVLHWNGAGARSVLMFIFSAECYLP